MRRHCLRWIPVAIVLVVTVLAATGWAKIVHMTDFINCPGIDANGNPAAAGSVKAIGDFKVNTTTGAYEGKTHAMVTNLSGRTVTILNLSLGLPGVTKSKYTVKVNGHATATVSGIAK